MAKIVHNNILETIVSVMTNAKESGALHLYAEGDSFNGRQLTLKGKDVFHFGTTGYLGLEHDDRLKQGAIEAVTSYGTQFPLSKSYVSHPLYEELEDLITKIYNCPIVITKNSTLGHLGVIPTVVNDGDGVILDHQVHWSVQSAVNPLKLRSVPVEMIRHNNLDMLEDKIKKLQSRCKKIWYMADGMYSMFGDFAPIAELMELQEKYSQLYIYFDDVHGMSWKGPNGSGYVMSILRELPERVILFSTLSKTFGASGAVVACRDRIIHQKIKNFGGPLTFSVQLEPASVGAAIASAKIHLSSEIYRMQHELRDLISYFNECIKQTNLPLIIDNESPIFYIGAGMPETGFNLVNKLIDSGYYVNTGIFPAVPVKNTGLRITVSRNNQKSDIKGLIEAIEENFPKSLAETNTSLDRIYFAFGKITQNLNSSNSKRYDFKIERFDSITQVDPELWNTTVGKNGFYDWAGLRSLEQIFRNNLKEEHNYDFFYYVVKDENGNCILATFLSYGLWKEDMLAPESVSKVIEETRLKQPYYHTNHCLTLGSMITEGEHLYLDQNHSNWQKAFSLLLDEIEILEKELQPHYVILRDFKSSNEELKSFLHNKGFIQVKMPQSAIFSNFQWQDEMGFINSLSKRSRKHFRNDIQPFQKILNTEIKGSLSQEILNKAYNLYLSVKANNLGLNTFDYPFSFFEHMNDSSQWEFILIRLNTEGNPLVGTMFCYKNSNNIFTPAVVGMDYNYSKEYNVYRQLLFQTILRAKELSSSRIDFGLTAGFEKRKVGAQVFDKCAYIQARDNFALEALDWLRKD